MFQGRQLIGKQPAAFLGPSQGLVGKPADRGAAAENGGEEFATGDSERLPEQQLGKEFSQQCEAQ